MAAQPPPFESRMLIDGQLVPGEAGDVRPTSSATEAVIGECTDVSSADVDRAIGAARRAFAETSWSTDHAFRQRCLLQLQDALEREREALREERSSRSAVPAWSCTDPSSTRPWPTCCATRRAHRRVSVAGRSRRRDGRAHRPDDVACGVARAGGRRRCDRPWNYPFEVMLHKVGQHWRRATRWS